jgi:hypothetical protein
MDVETTALILEEAPSRRPHPEERGTQSSLRRLRKLVCAYALLRTRLIDPAI